MGTMKSQEELWTHLCVTIEVIMNILIKNSDKIFLYFILSYLWCLNLRIPHITIYLY